MKICTKCNIFQSLDNFVKNKSKKDGKHNSCKNCRKQLNIENKQKTKEYNRKYHNLNKEELIKKRKIYNKENKKQIDEYAKNYYLNNKDSIIKRVTKYINDRKKIDPIFKLKANIRTRVSDFISKRGYKKKNTTQQLIGINYEGLKIYLENQFTEGMTWENYGKWHVDHKIPLANAKTQEEVYKLCHYTNLQPLWELDNKKKGAKI